ncbi:globin domain-containing protein [Ruegeria sp. 2205SS24-7]|uniref:globin domain-containing protein n=1 Tax=Ruegeria discodermiae TaxID=3064389 RepID=UPI002742755F|nr:globin domain-containing protein [Ruegeria sp. 2205SS24-7]MDP5218759.1 globin domain-containing protein [Ruegeria sp. 2205SS24-7]
MQLSSDDIDAIRTSFIQMSADLDRAGAVFYERLFEIAPETKDMFLEDMSVQATKLMSTLGLVISQLQNTQELTPVVSDLALRHLAYGVKREHYELVRQALIEMLETLLDGSDEGRALRAWAQAYDGLATVMIEAAYPKSDANARLDLNTGAVAQFPRS